MRTILLALLVVAAGGPAAAQTLPASRGALLYETHCSECHTTQMHWRTARLASDWTTLQVQVRRWQGEARLQWSEDDIAAVARHLNETIYHFPRPQETAQRTR